MGLMTSTTGKATAQLDNHDPIQTPMNALSSGITRQVAMNVMINVIMQVRIRPNRIGAKRAGIMVMS